MTKQHAISGVWVATLTPVDNELACDATRLADHCRRLLAAGCDGVAPFGTTGEGPSFSASERRRGLDALIAAGIPPERILLGTGSAALADTIELNRAAIAAGCAGVLMLPPFYFKDIDAVGIFDAYAHAIERTADPRLRLWLYNIPSTTTISLDYDMIGRLADRFPGIIAGVKDSSLDWRYTEPLLERFNHLAIFVGAENHLPLALAAGGAGTICGLANAAPALIRALADAGNPTAAAALLPRIEGLIARFENRPFVPALKAMLAAQRNDPAWRRVRPPLRELAPPAEQIFLDSLTDLILDPAQA
jgi:4-hydroxy-tetrahydrodipicolinate synthase